VSERLKRLVANGLLKRRRYQQRPARYEYRLTGKGLDLYPVIVMMMRWGDRWLAGRRGPPLVLTHAACGQPADPVVVCSHCRQPVSAHDIRWSPGPGARPKARRQAVA
jgi:DNA-binding Lrp family transcriptional regulator